MSEYVSRNEVRTAARAERRDDDVLSPKSPSEEVKEAGRSKQQIR